MSGSGRNFTWSSQDVLFNKRQYCWSQVLFKPGVLWDSSCPPAGQDTTQILPVLSGRTGWSGWRLFCCRLNRLMFYFCAHLKDLSVTLIRAAANAKQCFLSIQRPLPTPAAIYWEKKAAIFVAATFSLDLASWCQLIICPPESNTFSLCQNCGHGESRSSHTYTLVKKISDVSAHKQTH